MPVSAGPIDISGTHYADENPEDGEPVFQFDSLSVVVGLVGAVTSSSTAVPE